MYCMPKKASILFSMSKFNISILDSKLMLLYDALIVSVWIVNFITYYLIQ